MAVRVQLPCGWESRVVQHMNSNHVGPVEHLLIILPFGILKLSFLAGTCELEAGSSIQSSPQERYESSGVIMSRTPRSP